MNSQKNTLFKHMVFGLFPNEFFSEIPKTPVMDEISLKTIKRPLQLDYKFCHKPSGDSFWLETRYVETLTNRRIFWAEEWEMNRFIDFQNNIPDRIFIAIGFGGSPNKPNLFSCMPLDEINHWGIFPNILEKDSRSPEDNFWYRLSDQRLK